MSRGLQRERDVVKYLREAGYWALRSPASKGSVDVVAIKYQWLPLQKVHAHIVRFVECKSTQTPYSHFGPQDRADLLAEAEKAGASAELAWWPKNGKLRFIDSSDWPPIKLSGG